MLSYQTGMLSYQTDMLSYQTDILSYQINMLVISILISFFHAKASIMRLLTGSQDPRAGSKLDLDEIQGSTSYGKS